MLLLTASLSASVSVPKVFRQIFAIGETLLGRLLALPANIPDLPGTNALAYPASWSVAKTQKFYNLVPARLRLQRGGPRAVGRRIDLDQEVDPEL